MFDPFKDYETAGYLRNFAAEKNLDIVKVAEHELFRANLPDVVRHLAALTDITYTDFCQVHKTLFQGLYPWAGQDRSLTAPDSAVHKGETLFAHPADVRRAVEHALRLGRDATNLRERPDDWEARYNLERALWLAPEIEQAAAAEDEGPEPPRERVVTTLQGVRLDLP